MFEHTICMVCRCNSTMNCTSFKNDLPPDLIILFGLFTSIYIVIAILTILGNGIVIYVSHKTKSTGRLRYLDNVVKSLAVTDFLFGIVGAPIIITGYYMGKLNFLLQKWNIKNVGFIQIYNQ